MSYRHAGPWHYEFIEGRPTGHQWRVADEDDDVVRDFATEVEAQTYVRMHNTNLTAARPVAWRD